jgi:ribosome modulation factor
MLSETMEASVTSPHQRAWLEGHKVGKNNEPVNICPYGAGMMQVNWLKGWHEGAKTATA